MTDEELRFACLDLAAKNHQPWDILNVAEMYRQFCQGEPAQDTEISAPPEPVEEKPA